MDIVIPETDPANVYQYARTPFVAIARDEKGGDVSDLATFTWSFPDAKEPVGGNPAIYRFEKTGKFTVSVTATIDQGSGSDQISVNVIEFVGTKWNPTEDNFIFRARSGTHTFESTVCDGVELLVVPNPSNPLDGWEWMYASFEEKIGDLWIPAYGWYPQFVNDPQFEWCWRVSTGWSTELEKNAEVEWRVILALDDITDPFNSINVPVYESWTPDNTVVKPGGEMPGVILHKSTDTSHTIGWDISHYASGPIDPTFTVTVKIYDLSGSLVDTLVEEDVEVGSGSTTWDEDLPETDGIYTYVIEAEHSDDPAPVYPCADHDKSSLLTVTVNGMYYCSADPENGTLQGVVKYYLNRAAGYATIRFYDADLEEYDGSALMDSATQGTNWSSVFTLEGVEFDQNGQPADPIYCVVSPMEHPDDGQTNRDLQCKPAVQKGTTELDELLDLASGTLIGAPLTEAEEEDPGAFVHYNIDNDDESNNGLGGTKHPGSDLLQQEDAVLGEDDLLAVAATFDPTIQWGKAALVRTEDAVLVWTSASKGEDEALLVEDEELVWDLSVSGEYTAFHAAIDSLFVEGAEYNGEADLKLQFLRSDDTLICEDVIHFTALAADCGNQPRTVYDTAYGTSQRGFFESAFPLLQRCEWSIADGPTTNYNCIAWSVSETNYWYNKLDSVPSTNIIGIDEVYGDDDGVFEIADIDAFYLAKCGYEPTATGPGDADVMYYADYHAARREACSCGAGNWIMYSSKCGEWDRVEHTYDQLDEASYGQRTRYYK